MYIYMLFHLPCSHTFIADIFPIFSPPESDKINHHYHVQEGLGLIPVPCILKMKLVPPSLPQSSYVSSSFWFNKIN